MTRMKKNTIIALSIGAVALIACETVKETAEEMVEETKEKDEELEENKDE